VAMSQILIVHFIGHTLWDTIPLSLSKILQYFVNNGVNLFFMISGWCMIKHPIKGIVKLIVTVFLFSIINVALCIGTGIKVEPYLVIIKTVFPITTSAYWFIKPYLLLLILSPIINKGLNNIDLKSLRLVIALFSVFTVYSCGIAHNICNSNGYTFGQGLYMYCLATYLRRDNILYKNLRSYWLIAGFVFLAMASGIFAITSNLAEEHLYYNSLPNILSTTFLFLFLIRFKFQNKIVNRLGSASFGCYLLQDGDFGNYYFYGIMHDWSQSYLKMQWIGIYTAIFVAIWVASLLLSPIINRFANFIASKADKHLQKL
jgi:peptidoglycan/LPS O-acetylase OafA/YrhL